MNKTVLITHTDLDGIGCAVLFRFWKPEGTIYHANYDDVNQVARQAMQDHPGADICITDLSLDEDTARYIDRIHARLVLLDHHKTAAWMAEKYAWAHVDENRCGTTLFYDWLNRQRPRIDGLFKHSTLALLIDDYDRWQHKVPQSRELNRLLGVMGRERFIARFAANPETAFTDTEQIVLDLEREREQRYLEKTEAKTFIDPEGRTMVVCYADEYASAVGERLLAEHPLAQYAAIIQPRHSAISLRSRTGGVDVSEIAKRYGGGGHPGAAGYPYDAIWVATRCLRSTPGSE
jgi:oligoribonuclease NrnB/cAMP/cGMP phosphodiesterase (DHH superfamily)